MPTYSPCIIVPSFEVSYVSFHISCLPTTSYRNQHCTAHFTDEGHFTYLCKQHGYKLPYLYLFIHTDKNFFQVCILIAEL